MIVNGLAEAIGRTPLVKLRLDAPEGVTAYAKLEMHNPFGMKDRVARNIILSAREQGVLRPGAAIVESSSGTMALGVALVGRALGHDVHIVTDPRIDRITMAKLRALGCELHVVERMSAQGWQSARLERLKLLMRDLPGAFWPQQYTNPDNPGAYRALAAELVSDLGEFDVLVGSVGSGGSLCGSSRALRRDLPGLWVVGVDCVGSVLFDQPDVPQRLQSGVGNSLMPGNLDRGLIDEVHWLNDHEAFAATLDLAREQQVFGGNTSGSVYRVLGELARRAEPGTTLVGIFPDRGDRYADTLYSESYWERHTLADRPRSDSPDQVEYGTEVTSWSRAILQDVPKQRRHLLFVEANTTGTGMLALRTAEELGLAPVLLTGAPERYTGLEGTGCEVLRCDTNAMPRIREAITERFRREEITGVTTTSDFYTATVADIADQFGLPGNSAKAVRICRDKVAFRRTLEAAGVRQPRYAVVADPGQVREAVAAVGLPCVVKPSDGSGSENVLLCSDVREAAVHTEAVLGIRTNVRGQPTAGTVLIEEYVPGPEFSVEMFSASGETVCVGITAKEVTGSPYFVESGHRFPAVLPDADAEALVAAVCAALKACEMRLGPSHAEVKLTAGGAFVIEINPRLAGGMIPELIRLATGVSVLEQQLRAAADLPLSLSPYRDRHAGIAFLLADRAGVLREATGLPGAEGVPGVDRVAFTARPGSRVRPPRSAYDRLGHVIAHGDTPAEVSTALETAEREIHLLVDGEESGAI